MEDHRRGKGVGIYFWVRFQLCLFVFRLLIFDCVRSSNKMPLAVKEAIAYSVELHGGYSSAEAKHYVDAMVKDGKLIEECWS
jgi:hypothetical protein